MRVHDSQAYREKDVSRESISQSFSPLWLNLLCLTEEFVDAAGETSQLIVSSSLW